MSHDDAKVIRFGESFLFRAEKEVEKGYPSRLEAIDVDLKRFQKQLAQAQARVDKTTKLYEDTEAEMIEVRESLPGVRESIEFLKALGDDYDESEADWHRANVAKATKDSSLKPLLWEKEFSGLRSGF